MNIIETRLNQHLDQLSKSDMEVVKSLNEMANRIPQSKISDLAPLCFTSVATLHRVVKKLGFDGFSDFKYALKDEMTLKSVEKPNDVDYYENILKDIELTKRLNENEIVKIAKLFSHANKCYCYGTGWKQNQMIDNFSRDLLYYGKHFSILRTIDDLNVIGKDANSDYYMLILSLGGNGSEYVEAIKRLKFKGTTIISITKDSTNALAQLADYSLYFKYSQDDINKHWNTLTLHYLLENLLEAIVTES